MAWIQREIQLPSFPKGCHPISQHILKALPELAKIKHRFAAHFHQAHFGVVDDQRKCRSGRTGRSGSRSGHSWRPRIFLIVIGKKAPTTCPLTSKHRFLAVR